MTNAMLWLLVVCMLLAALLTEDRAVEKTDMISRAAAIEYLMTNMGWHDEDGYEVDDADEKRAIITDLVNGIPAVDAVEVVHGKWKQTDAYPHRLYCLKCYKSIVPNVEWIEAYNIPTDYCPNCGAKMDGGIINGTN